MNTDETQIFDLQADPGEKQNIAREHSDIVAKLDKAYDAWWDETLPQLENEQAYKTAPKKNPFRVLYYKQFQGPGPNNVPPGEAPAILP